MRAALLLLGATVLLLATSCTAQTQGYPDMANRPLPTASFCDRLAASSGYNWTTAAGARSFLLEFVRRAYKGAEIDLTLQPAPVTSFVQGLERNELTRAYFDSSINYRSDARSPYNSQGAAPDYTSNALLAHELDEKLAAFFGKGWGCTGRDEDTDESFGEAVPYEGSPNMFAVHAGMGVTPALWAGFNAQFAASALSFGATQYDFDRHVTPFLNSYARGGNKPENVICSAPSCPCATGWQGAQCDQVVDSTVTVTPGQGPQTPQGDVNSSAGKIAHTVMSFVVAMVALCIAGIAGRL